MEPGEMEAVVELGAMEAELEPEPGAMEVVGTLLVPEVLGVVTSIIDLVE